MVFERDGWKCASCLSRSNLCCHHIIFRSQGGDDATWNLITLCNTCHEAIHKRFILICTLEPDDDIIDADLGIKIMYINGWTPYGKRRVK